MNADYIKEIIREYEKMPYDCILVDGIWGIGKTEAVRDALKGCKNICFVSLFGMKDVQQIFHETFYQLGIKDKKRISELISKVGNIISLINPTAKIAKEILASLIKEKELF